MLARAAEQVLPMDPDAIPLGQQLYMFMWSTWGALASLLFRFAGGFEGTRLRVILVIFADFTSATLAGMLVFFGALHFNVPPMLVPVVVATAAYGGARTLDTLWRRLVSKVVEK